MTSPLASRVLDAALIGPTPDHGEAAGQGARARIHFKGTLADDRGADNSDVASDVDLATLGTELLAIPEVALILVSTGLLVTAMWAAHPRSWQLGISAAAASAAGATSLLATSPSAGALLLLALAAASLAMEVYSLPGLMLHAAGGATAVALAGLCLHGPWSGAHPGVSIPAALVVGIGTWSAARRSWRASRTDPWAEPSRLVGRELVVLHVVDRHRGHAVVAGQLWTIRDPRRPLVEGNRARVCERHGEELWVQQRRQRAGETD